MRWHIHHHHNRPTDRRVSLVQPKVVIKAAPPKQQLHPCGVDNLPLCTFTVTVPGPPKKWPPSRRVSRGTCEWMVSRPNGSRMSLSLSQLPALSKWWPSKLKDNMKHLPHEHPGLMRSGASCCLQLLSGCHLFMEECIPVRTPTLPYYYCPITMQLDTKPCCVQ